MNKNDTKPVTDEIVLSKHETQPKKIPQKSPEEKVSSQGSGHERIDEDSLRFYTCLTICVTLGIP